MRAELDQGVRLGIADGHHPVVKDEAVQLPAHRKFQKEGADIQDDEQQRHSPEIAPSNVVRERYGHHSLCILPWCTKSAHKKTQVGCKGSAVLYEN